MPWWPVSTNKQTIYKNLSHPHRTNGTSNHTGKATPHHQEPAQTVNIIPSLTNSSLFSISKFSDANYHTFFTHQDVQNFDSKNLKMVKTSEPILQEWQDKHTGLWWIPLIPTDLGSPLHQPQASIITNRNNSLNNVYDFPAQTKLSGTTMQWPGSSQKQHGLKPSKPAFAHHGQC